MSKENVKKFIEELTNNVSMQERLKKSNPTTLDDVVVFAKEAQLSFTSKELEETLEQMGALPLSDDVLEKISAGAYPTAVNNQITDSVT